MMKKLQKILANLLANIWKHYLYLIPILCCISLLFLFSAVLSHYTESRSEQTLNRQALFVSVVGKGYQYLDDSERDILIEYTITTLSKETAINYLTIDENGYPRVGDAVKFNPLVNVKIRQQVLTNKKDGKFYWHDGFTNYHCYYKWISTSTCMIVGVFTPLKELLPFWYTAGIIFTTILMGGTSMIILGRHLKQFKS